MTRPLTGRKVLAIFIGAFGIVFAVNFYMMYRAIDGFPGLVVQSSYVAGQGFDERRAAQEALGWRMQVRHDDGVLVEMIDRGGAALTGLKVRAVIGRPATANEDREVAFSAVSQGYRAPLTLAPGIWAVMLTASDAQGRTYRARTEIIVESEN